MISENGNILEVCVDGLNKQNVPKKRFFFLKYKFLKIEFIYLNKSYNYIKTLKLVLIWCYKCARNRLLLWLC